MDLIGKRVRLRARRMTDAAEITTMLSDPELVRHLGEWSRIPYGVADAEEFLRGRDATSRNWAIEALDDSAFLGMTGFARIDWQNRNAMWGIWLGPPSRWGRGYGTEACMLSVRYGFHELGLEKVQLTVFEGNERGRRTYEKCGFAVEGVLRRQLFREGGFQDVTTMAVFRDHPLYVPPADGEATRSEPAARLIP